MEILSPLRASKPGIRGVPDWVSDLNRIGVEEWRQGHWITSSARSRPHEHRILLEHFLLQVRSPFALEPGCRLWFGRDDLAHSTLRPRHAGLDVGARVRDDRGAFLALPAGTRFRTIVPGGYMVGGRNLQKVVYVYRNGMRRFRLILQISYEHAQLTGKARGRIRCFSTADQSEFLRFPCAFSLPIEHGGRIAGYEAFGWVKNPSGMVGSLEPGTYVTKDPVLAAREIPKGHHLHLSIAGVHDEQPDLQTRFLNEDLRKRIERA